MLSMNMSGGILAGLAVFAYARTRMRQLADQLTTIALMNHHIRNALQVIKYAKYLRPEKEQVAQVEDAVKRIEWALREVLPGRITDYDHDWKQGSPAAPEARPAARTPSNSGS